MYHQDDNQFYNLVVDSNDERSKWKLELASISPLSVEENILEQTFVQLYPNPTKDEFTIELSGFNKAKVVIYDVLGKENFKQIVNSSKIRINTNKNFKPGLYLIKIDTNDKIYFKKLLIK